MKNCLCCKHKVVKFANLEKVEEDMLLVKDNLHVKCLAGHNETIQDFYKNNGHVLMSEIDKIHIDCFEITEFSAMLDSTINKVENIDYKHENTCISCGNSFSTEDDKLICVLHNHIEVMEDESCDDFN